MSSARKKAFAHKAKQEADVLRQKLMLAEHHGSVFKALAEGLAKECDARQAKIDSLMLEHCPDEMAQEQKDNWAKHQKPVDETEAKKVDQAIGSPLKIETNDVLVREDGENQAVRMFLMAYGTGNHNIETIKSHLKNSGFDGYWPDWVNTETGHLTKAGAQLWLRHLFSMEIR